jgi:regulator of protease activity HflC (stomatin/prohibitin superfamily)
MAIRNAAASAVLGLLFLSLVAIFLLIPQNGLVTFLCILILVVSLIVAQSRRWRDIAVMAVLAGLVSIVAAYLFGSTRFGDFGAAVVTLIWIAVLFGLFNWTQRNMVTVPRDRAILITNRYSGAVHAAEGPIAPPLMPLVERRLAVIPLYELAEDAHVEKINTKRMNVDLIDVQVHYRVIDARHAMTGIPNRSQAQSELAKDMGKDLNEARLDVTFWEKLLSRQMKLEVDDIVREVVYDNPFAQNPLEVYAKREDLADIVRDHLSKAVRRWGVELTGLVFERVEVNPEVRKAINKSAMREEDTLVKEVEAKREATRIKLLGDAQAQVEADRVSRIVGAIQKAGVELSAEELRDIVIDAIHASAEVNMETALAARPLLEPPAARPAADKKDNGARK